MPIDPNIALSVKPIQLANPLEQYMQVQQVQGAQNQNRLADLMYADKQRENEQTTALNELYKNSVGADGAIDRAKLYGGMATGGLGSKLPAIQKTFLDTDQTVAKIDETKATTNKVKTETTGMKDKQREEKRQRAITDIAAFTSPQEALASLDAHEKAGDLTPESAASVRATIPANPADFPKWQIGMLQKIMSAKDVMGQLAPDANTVANNKQSGANTAVTAATSRRGQDMADKRAAEQNENGRGVIIQTDDGPMLANSRTGTTKPIIGPDGKAVTRTKPMTEFQGKSAGFADRAQEADTILAGLEKKGVNNSGVIKGVVQGAGEMVPFIGDKVGAALGSGMNTLPSALGGPSSQQQQVEQAQRNFINAILRQESGAAIGAGEFDNAKRQYFPQPGDSSDVIAQKAANRRTAIAGLGRSAGESYKSPAAAPAPQNSGLPTGWSVEAH